MYFVWYQVYKCVPIPQTRHHFVEIIIVTPTMGLSDLVIMKDLFRRIHAGGGAVKRDTMSIRNEKV